MPKNCGVSSANDSTEDAAWSWDREGGVTVGSRAARGAMGQAAAPVNPPDEHYQLAVQTGVCPEQPPVSSCCSLLGGRDHTTQAAVTPAQLLQG